MEQKSNLTHRSKKCFSKKEEKAREPQKGEGGENFRSKMDDEDGNLSHTDLKHSFDLGNQSNLHLSGVNGQSIFNLDSEVSEQLIETHQPSQLRPPSKISQPNPNCILWNDKEEQMKMDKNSNVLKHLAKKFIEKGFSRSLKKQFEGQMLKNEIFGFIEKQKKSYKIPGNHNHNNNLKSLKRIFGQNPNSKDPKKRSFLLRRHLALCIRKVLIKDVFNNRQITSLKKSYVYSMLIQIYRCGNIDLLERTQII